VHVEPERPLEQGLGDQEPVGRDDDDIDVMYVYTYITRVEALGLEDGDAEPLRRRLRGRGRGAAAAAARTIRPREQRDDVVPAGEPLEHVGAERRRRRDGEPRH
jgi:hypothetical protein